MIDFTYYAPSVVIFGREAEEQVAQIVRKHGYHKYSFIMVAKDLRNLVCWIRSVA